MNSCIMEKNAASCETSKGGTTITRKMRKALSSDPGESLRSLKGALASKKGRGMSFAEIRKAAAEAASTHK